MIDGNTEKKLIRATFFDSETDSSPGVVSSGVGGGGGGEVNTLQPRRLWGSQEGSGQAAYGLLMGVGAGQQSSSLLCQSWKSQHMGGACSRLFKMSPH